MRTAAVSSVKARLSEFLRHVQAGEEVLIVDRGRPVARLAPPMRRRAGRAALGRLERQGLIRLGSGRLPPDFLTRKLAKDPGDTLLQALLEERRGGR